MTVILKHFTSFLTFCIIIYKSYTYLHENESKLNIRSKYEVPSLVICDE